MKWILKGGGLEGVSSLPSNLGEGGQLFFLLCFRKHNITEKSKKYYSVIDNLCMGHTFTTQF